MDPIGVLVQVKHRRMIHQMVAFLKGTYVSFNKSWEEDTLKKPKHVKLVVSKNFGGHGRIWPLPRKEFNANSSSSQFAKSFKSIHH